MDPTAAFDSHLDNAKIKRSLEYFLRQSIRMPKRIPDVRYAANPLDYRKMIIPRSFEKDWRPKDPRRVLPRMRQIVAFNNNR